MSFDLTPEDELELASLEALWRETIISMEKELNNAPVNPQD